MRSSIVLPLLLALAGSASPQQTPRHSPSKAMHNPAKPEPRIASQVGTGENIVTHLADGDGWKSTITIINLSQSKDAVYSLDFYGDDGNAQSFFFEGLGDNTIVQGALNPGGSIVLETTGTGSLTEGWAQFDSSTSEYVSGFAVFSNSNGNEAAVPFESVLATNQILSFDNTGGYGMGVALANSDFMTMTISATFRSEAGSVLGTDTFKMDSMTHTAFIFANQWPFTAGQKGIVYFEPTDSFGTASGLAILGLRYTPELAFTSVTSLRATTLD
jgi:hypothetical protein